MGFVKKAMQGKYLASILSKYNWKDIHAEYCNGKAVIQELKPTVKITARRVGRKRKKAVKPL